MTFQNLFTMVGLRYRQFLRGILYAILLLGNFLYISHISSSAQLQPDPNVRIAVFCLDEHNAYRTALDLDPRTPYDLFVESNQSAFLSQNYSAIFIIDYFELQPLILSSILNRISIGMGLFFQTNSPDRPYNLTSITEFQQILPVELNLTSEGIPNEVYHPYSENINTREVNASHFLKERVSFLSFPQLLNLTETVPNTLSSTQVLLKSDSNWAILTVGMYGGGQVIVLNAPIRSNSNEQVKDWPMFNYMIFATALSLSGINNYEDFGAWQGSPIPNSFVINLVWIVVSIISAVTIIGLLIIRKYSQSHPLHLQPIKQELIRHPVIEIIPDNHSHELELSNKGPHPIKKTKELTWDEVGFHKPLAGFSMMFYSSLGFFLPVILVIMYILPNYILKDPSQYGILYISSNIFNAVFVAGDFGLAQAFDKYVGEHYLKDPREALKYIQFFVWFQMISGLIQTAGIAFIGIYLIPKSLAVAFMAYQFTLKAFVQWPGIADLFTHTLKALQRTDKEQYVNLIALVLFDLVGIAIFSSLSLAIGNSDPRIGPIIGGALGFTIAEVVKSFGLLFLSGHFFSKLDNRFLIRDCFRVDFALGLVKRTLYFGFKSMLSSVVYLIGNLAFTLIIMFYLPNYTYWSAFLAFGSLILYPVQIIVILFQNILPTNAEAYCAGCKRLSGQYLSNGFKYFGLYGSLVFVIYAFFVNGFLKSMLPALFQPIGFFLGYYPMIMLAMCVGEYSRLFLISIDKIGQYILFVLLEQVIRIAIFFVLITRISQPEYLLLWGELPGVIIKVILTWWYTDRKIIRVHIHRWQSFGAPIISSMIFLIVGLFMNQLHSILVNLFRGQFLIPTIIMSLLLCPGLAMTLYPLLVGFLGGWDDRALKDLDFAAQNSGPSSIFAIVFYKMTCVGVKISPFHNRTQSYATDLDEELEHLNRLKVSAYNNK